MDRQYWAVTFPSELCILSSTELTCMSAAMSYNSSDQYNYVLLYLLL